MNKFKIATRNNVTLFIMKSLKGQQLADRDVEALQNNKMGRMLSLKVERKRSSFTLNYDITGYIPLKDYLVGMDKKKFGILLDDIISTVKEMQVSYYYHRNLIMDLDHVFVDPASGHIYFLYIPIQYFDNGVEFKSFLLSIAQKAVYEKDEDTAYVREYIKILNKGVNFSLFELEEYIKRLLGRGNYPAPQTIKCKKCAAQLEGKLSFCPYCGYKLTGDTMGVIYDPLHQDQIQENMENRAPDSINSSKTATERKSANEFSGDIHQDDMTSETQDFSSDTTVLGTTEMGEETVDLTEWENRHRNFPYLIRGKDKEKIVITKDLFKIGKDTANCDYAVTDNSAVSRNHACFITRDNRIFIRDSHSKNGTFIDNRRIAADKEYELLDRQLIRLGNEEFEFYCGD